MDLHLARPGHPSDGGLVSSTNADLPWNDASVRIVCVRVKVVGSEDTWVEIRGSVEADYDSMDVTLYSAYLGFVPDLDAPADEHGRAYSIVVADLGEVADDDGDDGPPTEEEWASVKEEDVLFRFSSEAWSSISVGYVRVDEFIHPVSPTEWWTSSRRGVSRRMGRP